MFSKFKSNGRRTSTKGAPGDPSPPDSDSASLDDKGNDTGIASTDYARRCRELMELHEALREMGAETLVDLPRIVVIGGQSTGKSSLVEAVSGISVPRDAGTCTRCPMECSMSSSAQSWSCTISLRFYNDGAGNELLSPKRQSFGPAITNKSEVEIWLRRAQAAILNSPRIPCSNFFNKTAQELRDGTRADMFSNNVICVDIKDPNATELSFVDLPGLIQNQSPEAIAMVKQLVESYIASEKTLILIAIPISDDMENQQAVRLAREADPEGKRTIGVLTKPDTLSEGATTARQRWKDIFQGRVEEHRLKLGYYCVRLPDDEERRQNTSHSDFHRLVSEWFDTSPPWNEIEDRSRFGVPSLVSDLGRLLVDLIDDNFPSMLRDVNRLLSKCRQSLGNLPILLTPDPATEILTRVAAFCETIKGAITGNGLKTLAQGNREIYSQYQMKIYKTAPDFRPIVHPTALPESPASYSRRSVLADDEFFDDPLDPNESTPVCIPKQTMCVSPPPEVAVEVFDLTKVRKVIKDSIAWELPHNIPFEAKKFLILKSISLWDAPTISCFEDVFANLSNILYACIEVHFGRFKKLQAHIESLIKKEVDDCRGGARLAVLKTLSLEKMPLFTRNEEFLESERTKWLNGYQQTHHNPGYPFPEPHRSSKWGSVCQCEPPPRSSPYDQEMLVMAEVRAYFEVAYRRIIDYIPLTIEHELCQALANNLQQILFKSISAEQGLSKERKKELLSEDPDIAARRQRLEEKERRLVDIKKKLDAVHARMRAPHISVEKEGFAGLPELAM